MYFGSVTVILRYGLFWFPWKPNKFSRSIICTECIAGWCCARRESRYDLKPSQSVLAKDIGAAT